MLLYYTLKNSINLNIVLKRSIHTEESNMLEILGVYYLCQANKRNAMARGRKPGLFIGLTISLWFIFEIFTDIMCVLSGFDGYAIYMPGLFAALIGGLISYVITRNCRIGTYISPDAQMTENVRNTTEALTVPATVEIVRKSRFSGSLVGYSLTLNGHSIGTLNNGKTIMTTTTQTQNILGGKDAYGQTLKPAIFTVGNQSRAIFEFKSGKFLLKSMSAGAAVPLINYAVPGAAGSGQKPVPVQFCRSCGTKVTMSGGYCANCGGQL